MLFDIFNLLFVVCCLLIAKGKQNNKKNVKYTVLRVFKTKVAKELEKTITKGMALRVIGELIVHIVEQRESEANLN